MGIFSKSKTGADNDYSALAAQPGAIPVATPVPEVRDYQAHQAAALAKATTTGPATATTTAFPTHHPAGHPEPFWPRSPTMVPLCPHCKQESRTRTTTSPTWETWTASGVLLLAFWPICWLPLVMDNCKKTEHHCVLCGNLVASVAPFQDCCVTTKS